MWPWRRVMNRCEEMMARRNDEVVVWEAWEAKAEKRGTAAITG
jgi:hypothetical protein